MIEGDWALVLRATAGVFGSLVWLALLLLAWRAARRRRARLASCAAPGDEHAHTGPTSAAFAPEARADAGSAEACPAPDMQPLGGLEPEPPVVIARFGTSLDAAIARLRLDGAGIPSALLDEAAFQAAGPLQVACPVRLLVRAADRDRALQVLAEASPPTELVSAMPPPGRGTEPESAPTPQADRDRASAAM